MVVVVVVGFKSEYIQQIVDISTGRVIKTHWPLGDFNLILGR